jgi:hypothetical protein
MKPSFSKWLIICLLRDNLILGIIMAKGKQDITISFSPEEAKVVIASAVIKFSG